MYIFDRLDPLKLDRRNAQLWMLAIAMIVILVAGMALILYPTAFEETVNISGSWMRSIYFSFCVLSCLMVGYLMERRIAIRILSQRLKEEKGRNIRLLQQASLELLETLPKFGHFQDQLTMEFRRATSADQPLSVIIISLTPGDSHEADDLVGAYGDAAKSILRRLRREDSLYYFRPGVFGILVPSANAADAKTVGRRLVEGFGEFSKQKDRVTFDMKVINYPNDAASAREIQNAAASAYPAPLLLAKAA
jgi:GGDEF domain-containing protein